MSNTASKTKKPVDSPIDNELAALKQEIQELKDAAAAPVVVKRETIEAIRNNKNPLEIRPNAKWPAMFEIFRSEGGQIPPELNGQFTSVAEAERLIAGHLG